ncbi:hypothetical protein CANINC_000869 [Pichia inconspicua]|uniref:Dihydrolipoamide dehydrogenase-binding protein of pyruvate dehydrogenase complex n=1 Tax=Pichia inconspicua TaxID=52247 RepID=A0A4T0X4Y1_9ASCO|nr:hypothetical protein CANINC_000869 [[Candida] inconspicua]
MPAMSPTMESGAIVEWHVKEGDSFSSGKSLLDIETDKATISVDAIDDGIVAKILLPDGTKDIKVGTPIAILADPDDDLSTLELPEITVTKPVQAIDPEPVAAKETKSPKSTPSSNTSTASKLDTSASQKADPNQRLFPSVENLLKANNISEAEAFEKIPATGPHGRILKGDVLAYLGKIPSAENEAIAKYLEKSSHLDLSQIQLKETSTHVSSEELKSVDASQDKAVYTRAKKPAVISHFYPLDIEVSYSDFRSFKEIIAEVVEFTEKEAYAHKLIPDSDLNDPLFDELIAPPRSAERFKIDYKINYEEGEVTGIDINLTLNSKCYDAKERAHYFLNEFKNNLTAELAELSTESE